jgi:hypothetical protein
LPGWILLLTAPRWRWTQRYATLLIPAILAPLYIWLLTANWSSGGFGSLREITQLFSNPALLLAGWIHYLIFDLFIGAWQTRDAAVVGVPHLALVPCLVLTFLLGPAGLFLYLLLRTLWKRRLDIGDAA